MVVTFKSNSSPDLTMHGEIAVQLIQMTGHSGEVPGAILGANASTALNSLQRALKNAADDPVQNPVENEDGEAPVSLQKRAGPLMQMLENASKKDDDVIWNEGF